jgi:glycosyltransferase involved in cell wall biosynthesis
MRILQLLNRVPWPLFDGGSVGYYNFIKGYAEAGCEVTVLAMNTSRHNVSELPKELTNIATWHLVEVDNRINPLDAFLNLFSSQSYNIQRFESAAFDEKLKFVLNQQTFDVVVFESLFVMPYYHTVSSQTTALTVLRQHNVEHIIWNTLANRTNSLVKKWYLKLLAARLQTYEQQALNKVDALTTLTVHDKQTLIELGCTKPIHVTPLAVSMSEELPKNENLTVFHIGSMEWMPNTDGIRWFINEVWPKVISTIPTAQLHLAGRGIDGVLTSDTKNNIIVDGEVADAATYMNEHGIMIVPLFSGSGIRVKILEGMAAGKAIVSTSLGAQGIEYTHNKNILIADTTESFAHAVIDLLQSPQKVGLLGDAGKLLVSKTYSYEKVIGDVIDFYRIQIQNKVKDV